MTPRPRWASATAAVAMASSGLLFLAAGHRVATALALLVGAVFLAEARRGSP